MFGVTVSGRAISAIPGANAGSVDGMVGMTINTLPARYNVNLLKPVGQWLNEIQLQQVSNFFTLFGLTPRFRFNPVNLNKHRW